MDVRGVEPRIFRFMGDFMLIKWVALCHQSAVEDIGKKILEAIAEDTPDTQVTLTERPFIKEPEFRWLSCQYSAACFPSEPERKIMKISGHDVVEEIDQEQYRDFSARVRIEEMRRSPEKAFVVCAAYKNL